MEKSRKRQTVPEGAAEGLNKAMAAQAASKVISSSSSCLVEDCLCPCPSNCGKISGFETVILSILTASTRTVVPTVSERSAVVKHWFTTRSGLKK